jgi:hypothetical protein
MWAAYTFVAFGAPPAFALSPTFALPVRLFIGRAVSSSIIPQTAHPFPMANMAVPPAPIQFHFSRDESIVIFTRYHGANKHPGNELGKEGDLFLIENPPQLFMRKQNLWEPWVGVTTVPAKLMLHPLYSDLCLNMSATLDKLNYYSVKSFLRNRSDSRYSAHPADDSGYRIYASNAIHKLRDEEGDLGKLRILAAKNLQAALSRKKRKAKVKNVESEDAEGKGAEGKDAEGEDAEGKDEEGKDEEGKDEEGKDEEGTDAEANGARKRRKLQNSNSVCFIIIISVHSH